MVGRLYPQIGRMSPPTATIRSELTDPWPDNLRVGGVGEPDGVNKSSGEEGNLRCLSQTGV